MYMMFEKGTAKINFRRCIPYSKESFAFFISKNLVAVITNVHNDSSTFALQRELYKVSEDYLDKADIFKEKPTLVDRAFRRWGQGQLERTASAVFQLPALLANYFDYGTTDSLFFDEAELEYLESKFAVNNYRALCQIFYVDVLGYFQQIAMEELYEVEKVSQNRPLLKSILEVEDGSDDPNLDLITFSAVATYMAENDVYCLLGMDDLHEHFHEKRMYNIAREKSKEEATISSGAIALNEVLPYFTKYPGLERVNNAEVFERFYRSVAKRLHPDRNGGDGVEEYKAFEEDFKMLRESKWLKFVEKNFYEQNKFVDVEVTREHFDFEIPMSVIQDIQEACTMVWTRMQVNDMILSGKITEAHAKYLWEHAAVTIEYDPIFDYGVGWKSLLARQRQKEACDGV